MDPAVLVYCSFILGIINLVTLSVIVVTPHWRVSSTIASDPSFFGLYYNEGLWLSCTVHRDEYFQCRWHFHHMNPNSHQFPDRFPTDGIVGIDGT